MLDLDRRLRAAVLRPGEAATLLAAVTSNPGDPAALMRGGALATLGALKRRRSRLRHALAELPSGA